MHAVQKSCGHDSSAVVGLGRLSLWVSAMITLMNEKSMFFVFLFFLFRFVSFGGGKPNQQTCFWFGRRR